MVKTKVYTCISPIYFEMQCLHWYISMYFIYNAKEAVVIIVTCGVMLWKPAHIKSKHLLSLSTHIVLPHFPEVTTCNCHSWLLIFPSTSSIICLYGNFLGFLLLYWDLFIDFIYWIPVIIDDYSSLSNSQSHYTIVHLLPKNPFLW